DTWILGFASVAPDCEALLVLPPCLEADAVVDAAPDRERAEPYRQRVRRAAFPRADVDFLGAGEREPVALQIVEDRGDLQVDPGRRDGVRIAQRLRSGEQLGEIAGMRCEVGIVTAMIDIDERLLLQREAPSIR